MTEWRQRVLVPPLNAVRAYERGETDLEYVQSALDAAAGVLESPDRELAEAMRQAEADLETIRFTVSRDEEREAAFRVLDPLRVQIESALP